MQGTKKRRKPLGPEPLVRYGLIDRWDLDVFAVAQGRTPAKQMRLGSIYLSLQGKFTEPLRGVSDFTVQISGMPAERAEDVATSSVGYVISLKPTVQAVVDLTEPEFQAVLVVANAGRLAGCRFCLDEPRYGKARIISVSLGTSSEASAIE